MRFWFFSPDRFQSTRVVVSAGSASRKSAGASLLIASALLSVILTPVLIAKAAERSTASTLKISGTYRIEGWREMEKRELYHFFYLHPGGQFLLGAAWPGHETSRFVGTWSVSGGQVTLKGKGKVETNQGNWTVAFLRTFRIAEEKGGIRLAPILEKNRYGLMGWPNAFRFHRKNPAPNLPGIIIPAREDEILRHIQRLLGK